jgi:hypothetical protein
MITGSWVSQCLGAAARLGIADHLAGEPKTAEELARASGAGAWSLFRLMRALAGLGILTQPLPGKFGLSALGELLRSGVPGTLRDFAIATTDHAHWATWERFTEGIRTGRAMGPEVLGMDLWDYYARHPEDAAFFTAAMGNLSSPFVPAIAEGYDFSSATKIVDVAGAHGDLLAEILRRNPKPRGVLFDLAHVVKDALPLLQRCQVADRIELAAGDFFQGVPAGGDVYLLKHVIHDWDDEHSIQILESIRAAMRADGKVLIIELLIPPGNEASPAQLIDLNMLVMLNGKERTEAEYASLLEAARLKLDRLMTTCSPYVLLQASPSS